MSDDVDDDVTDIFAFCCTVNFCVCFCCRSIVVTAFVFWGASVGSASVGPVSSFFTGGYLGMVFHIGFMIYFMAKKKKDLAKEATKDYGETTLTADGKTIIFSRKMTFCQKLFSGTVGLLLSLIDFILTVVANVTPLDLRVIFFPLPFYNYWKSKLLVGNMRIKGAKIRLNATYSDAYFLWLKIQRNNLLTLGCYEQFCFKLGYEKWLDSKLQWYGTPPPGFTNEFLIFAVRPSLCERLQIAAIEIIFGWFPGAICDPFTRPYVILKTREFEMRHMIIGGVTPKLNSNWTYNKVLNKYWESCCGCRSLVMPRYADECIEVAGSGGDAAAPTSPDMERQ